MLVMAIFAGEAEAFDLGFLHIVKKPKIAFDRAEVKSVSADGAVVEFVFKADNPNSFGVDHVLLDYDLSVDGQKVLSGRDVKIPLKAKGATEVRQTVEIKFDKVFASALDLARAVLEGKKSVPYAFEGVFKLDVFWISFTIPIKENGDLPLPTVEDLGKAIKKALPFF